MVVVNTLAMRAAALALTVLALGMSLPSAARAAPLALAGSGTGASRVLIGTAGSAAFTGVGSVLSPLYDYPVLANSLPGGNNNFVSGALAPYAGNYYFGATSAVVTVRYAAAIAAGSVSGAFTVTAGNAVIGDPTVTGTTSTSAPATLTASAGNALICVGGNLATVPSNGSGIAAGATPTQIVVTANANAGPKAAAAGGAALGTSVPGLPIGCGDTRKLQVFTENVSGGSVVDTILVAVNHTLQGVTTPNTFTVAQGSGTQLTTRAVTKTALATPASTLTGVVNPTTNSSFAVSITPGAFAPGTNDTASTNFVLTSTSAAAGGLYSDVWDPTTGNLALVHAISASFFPSQLLVADGAAPALVAVRRIMTGPDSGAIVLQFSEAMQAQTNFSSAQTASLAPMNQIGLTSTPPINGLPALGLQTATGTLASDYLNAGSYPGALNFNSGWGVLGTQSANLPSSDTTNRSTSTIVFDIGTNPTPGQTSYPAANAAYLQSFSLSSVGTISAFATGFVSDASPFANAPISTVINGIAYPSAFSASPNSLYTVSSWPVLNNQGNISTILIFLNQAPAALTPSQLTALAAQFSVTVRYTTVTPSAASITGSTISLTLPVPINPNPGNYPASNPYANPCTVTCSVTLSGIGTTITAASNPNLYLVSPGATNQTLSNLTFASVVGAGSSSAAELLTQTITGKISKNGTSLPGAFVRAEIIRVSPHTQVTSAHVSLPVISGGTKVVLNDVPLQLIDTLEGEGLDFITAVDNAEPGGPGNDPFACSQCLSQIFAASAAAGQSTITGYVNYIAPSSGGAAVAFLSAIPADSVALQYAQTLSGASMPPVQSYQVQVATGPTNMGAITGVGGDSNVTGQLVLQSVGQRLVLSGEGPVFAEADVNGNYRLSVALDTVAPNREAQTVVVLMSVLEPGGQDANGNQIPWKLGTYFDPSLSGYLPFKPDINVGAAANTPGTTFTTSTSTTGSNGGTVQNIDTALIGSTPISSTSSSALYDSWTLLGFPGNIARNTTSLGSFKSATFLMGANPVDGSIQSYWYPVYNDSGNAQDNNSYNTLNAVGLGEETFVLTGNTVKSDFEFNGRQATVNNIGSTFGSGLALALNMQGHTMQSYTYGTNPVTGASTYAPQVVNYPLASPTLTSAPLPAGWSLITYNGANTGDPSLLGATATAGSPVTMIISASDNSAAQTWIKGATTQNTLTSLTPGAAYFVYLPTAATAFTFR